MHINFFSTIRQAKTDRASLDAYRSLYNIITCAGV